MVIYAVFIITDDGRTILSEHFQSVEGITNDILFGGVLTALQSMTAMMTKSDAEISTIEIESLSYHVMSFGLIRIVIVTDGHKKPIDALQTLGLRFINQYGTVLMQTDFNLNIFKPFKSTIHEIITEETIIDESRSIKPARKLGTGEIFELPIQIQSTALALVSLVKGTLEEISQESGEEVTDTEKSIAYLQNMGYVGKKNINEKTVYFCSF